MLKEMIASALLVAAGSSYAFAPQAGTWVVTSEVNGQPGRGLAIDVQNTTMVMQMYAYESNGKATFYLAVGDVANNTVTAPLHTYSGGRYFGSGPRSGTDAGSPGNVKLRFTSGTTGFITFPNEPEVAISRFAFGYPSLPQSLKGIWSFTSIGSEGFQGDAQELTVNTGESTADGNGIVANNAQTFGCEHKIKGSLAGTVVCVKINTQGQLIRAYNFAYSVNEGEGASQSTLNNSQAQLLIVRRLTTSKGDGTGLVLKTGEQDVPAIDAAVLRQHIEQLSLQNE